MNIIVLQHQIVKHSVQTKSETVLQYLGYTFFRNNYFKLLLFLFLILLYQSLINQGLYLILAEIIAEFEVRNKQYLVGKSFYRTYFKVKLPENFKTPFSMLPSRLELLMQTFRRVKAIRPVRSFISASTSRSRYFTTCAIG